MTLTLSKLPYAFDALQPHMSKETFEYHYAKHHQAYVDNGNKLLPGSGFENLSLDAMQKAVYDAKNQPLINNVGQVYNHHHFWYSMKPNGGGKKMPGKIEKLVNDYGGYDKVRTDFVNAGMTQFGSGWAWLVVNNGKLEVTKTANGDNPLMLSKQPILVCDVWEHAYYIDYRNLRQKFLETFVDELANWEHAEEMIG